MAFKWLDPEPINISEEIRENFSNRILLAELLSKRGIKTKEQASAFLDPSQYTSLSPFLFPEMEKAISRLNSAIMNHENIGIWGDFDADGQTATTLLVSALKNIGGSIVYRVPVRAQESHGIQASQLKTFIEKNSIDLIITCDTGISEVEGLQLAARMHTDVILTDHHTPPDLLPQAHAIINPKLLSTDHPFYHLAGVGTAYQVIRALFETRGEKVAQEDLLDLVALGTIADIAELNLENRFLVQKGIACLNTRPRPALQALLDLAGMKNQPIDESMISFVIAPRLNAAGRLGDANRVIDFLLSENAELINRIALDLEDLNFQRKMKVDAVMDSAMMILQTDKHLLDFPVIILSKQDWEKGVVGIAASQIVEEFNKPAILLSETNGVASGSARSIEGVDIIAAIRQNDHLLHSYGGHPMAAGLSLDSSDIDAFRFAISKTVAGMVKELPGEKILNIDAILPLSGISNGLIAEIRQLSPFGAGNPAPILVSRDVSIASKTIIGKKGEHIKLEIRDEEGEKREAIWWRGAQKPMPEDHFDLAYHIQPKYWKGQFIPQIEWLDYHMASREKIEIERVHRKIEITDLRTSFRDADHDLPFAKETDVILWGENLRNPLQIQVMHRFQLTRGDTLVILTAPPSQSVLFNMIDLVKPGKIIFMDLPGSKDTLTDHLSKLMGLVKYGINHKNGNVDTCAIASALCQTEATIRAGVDWLAAQGKLRILNRDKNVVKLEITDQPSSGNEPAVRKKLLELLEETAAYRSYYKRCRPEQLLPPV